MRTPVAALPGALPRKAGAAQRQAGARALRALPRGDQAMSYIAIDLATREPLVVLCTEDDGEKRRALVATADEVKVDAIVTRIFGEEWAHGQRFEAREAERPGYVDQRCGCFRGIAATPEGARYPVAELDSARRPPPKAAGADQLRIAR